MQIGVSKSAIEQESTEHAVRLMGLGLAGISTIFQAVMSVCAKSLGVRKFDSVLVDFRRHIFNALFQSNLMCPHEHKQIYASDVAMSESKHYH